MPNPLDFTVAKSFYFNLHFLTPYQQGKYIRQETIVINSLFPFAKFVPISLIYINNFYNLSIYLDIAWGLFLIDLYHNIFNI